jgi:hypothetical protein
MESVLENRPVFIITIDTEGDDLWSQPQEIGTKNAKFIPRFQELCEKYRLRPTYLTNFEMAVDEVFLEIARDLLHRKAGEVGMHLHAWNSPPLIPFTDDDFHWGPFLIEYPDEVMLQKVEYLTKLLEDTLQTKMTSHRAGRWAFNETYARILADLGYRVDCSVTPGVSWDEPGDAPAGIKGTDYSSFPRGAYFLDLDAISRPGDSKLLEVPVSIDTWRPAWARAASHLPVVKKLAWRMAPAKQWMRPRPKRFTHGGLMNMAARYARNKSGYLQFMIHSSEFMPGGSPYYQTQQSVDALFQQMEELFEFCASHYRSLTLTEYANAYSN